jgi:hypothetical protein
MHITSVKVKHHLLQLQNSTLFFRIPDIKTQLWCVYKLLPDKLMQLPKTDSLGSTLRDQTINTAPKGLTVANLINHADVPRILLSLLTMSGMGMLTFASTTI